MEKITFLKPLFEELYLSIGNLSISHKIMTPWKGEAAVLMYHRVLPKEQIDFQHPDIGCIVSSEHFEQQIRYLKENYQIVGISDLCNLQNESNELLKQGQFPVVITFDDGYKDNLMYALPILEKYQVPATIYMVTRFLEENVFIWWYEIWEILKQKQEIQLEWQGESFFWKVTSLKEKKQCFQNIHKLILSLNFEKQKELLSSLREEKRAINYRSLFLNEEELLKLDRHPLITIGAHTHTHPNLRMENDETAFDEISRSKKILEKLFQHPVEHFAYPFGSLGHADEREFQFAKKSGFKTAVTTRVGPFKKGDWWNICRFYIADYHTPKRLSTKISGWNAFWKRDL